MADEEIGGGETPPEPETTGDAKRVSVQIRQAAKQLADTGHTNGDIRRRVIDTLAEEIMNERVQLVIKAVRKREELQRNFSKIRPDQVLYNADGSKASEAFSKGKLDELKKAQEELAKADKAIDGATGDKADYEGLKKLIGN